MADLGVQIPNDLVTDCVRLCCSLCLLESDPTVISPDVLSKDRGKFDDTGDEKFVDNTHRRGKVAMDHFNPSLGVRDGTTRHGRCSGIDVLLCTQRAGAAVTTWPVGTTQT